VSVVGRASTEALLEHVQYFGGRLRLSGTVYRRLAAAGLSRAQVAAAVEELVAQGRLRVSLEDGVVVIVAKDDV
jgi:hypothetical protein